MPRRRLLAWLFASLLALTPGVALAGCGGDSNPSSDDSNQIEPGALPNEDESEGPASENEDGADDQSDDEER